jgi:hypothetical protein
MMAFTVTVRSAGRWLTYPAIGSDSCAVHMAALDLFGVCSITVKPA